MAETDEANYDVLILGGGPAGTTAAIYASRANLKTAVVDKGVTAGALGITGKIANYPGISEEISGLELLQRMRGQAKKFGTEFIQDHVQGLDITADPKVVYGNLGNYTARAVVIATGAMGRTRRIPGEEKLLGNGVSYCATCDGAFYRDMVVAVTGSNDEAIQEALFLTRFASQVHFFSPSPELKAPQELMAEFNKNPKVVVYLGAAVQEVLGETAVQAIKYNQRGKGEQLLEVSGVFFYLQGAQPITDFLLEQLPINETGCLNVNSEFQTVLPGVYAIGDVLCDHVKQAVVSAAEGAVTGIAIEKYLRGRKQLTPDWSK
jgi:thioredoxin reductase (NADPH)